MSFLWGRGAFLPTFQTKLKFYEISIYLHKVTELCVNKSFGHVETSDLVLKSIKLASCGS